MQLGRRLGKDTQLILLELSQNPEVSEFVEVRYHLCVAGGKDGE